MTTDIQMNDILESLDEASVKHHRLIINEVVKCLEKFRENVLNYNEWYRDSVTWETRIGDVLAMIDDVIKEIKSEPPEEKPNGD